MSFNSSRANRENSADDKLSCMQSLFKYNLELKTLDNNVRGKTCLYSYFSVEKYMLWTFFEVSRRGASNVL